VTSYPASLSSSAPLSLLLYLDGELMDTLALCISLERSAFWVANACEEGKGRGGRGESGRWSREKESIEDELKRQTRVP
jgi:hypothetical protein